MLDKLLHWDQEISLLINQSGTELLDPVMLAMSNKWIWIPLYAWLIYRLYLAYKKQFLWVMVMMVLLITLSDQISSSIIKPAIERSRPCQEVEMTDQMRTLETCGKRYSFPSGHATNSMSLAVMVILLLPRTVGFLMLIWAVLIGYSRVYLGAHYVLDVFAGFLLGYVLAVLVFAYFNHKFALIKKQPNG